MRDTDSSPIPAHPMTGHTAAEALLAEALHKANTTCGFLTPDHEPVHLLEARDALLAHPALADTLLRGLGAGRGEDHALTNDCLGGGCPECEDES